MVNVDIHAVVTFEHAGRMAPQTIDQSTDCTGQQLPH